MLIYHPAFDAYHSVVRQLRVLAEHEEIELSKLRLLDFYLVFPYDLARLSLPKGHLAFKRAAAASDTGYRSAGNAKLTFRSMEQLQLAAAGTLVAAGLLDSEKFRNGYATRTSKEFPESVASILRNVPTDPVSQYVLTQFASIPLQGPQGLKARTGLLEYRYDYT